VQFFAAGQVPVGVIAIGQIPTGVIAIGQGARGVIAIGQLSCGVVAIGQLAVGLVAFGQLALGGMWGGGMLALAPTGGTSLLGYGPIGEISASDLFRLRLGRFTARRPGAFGIAVAAVCAALAGWLLWTIALGPLLDEFTRVEPPPPLR
jgi:hypothetical protein